MPLDVSQAAGLLISPLTGHLVEEVPANLAVELVDIHGVNAGLEPVVLGTKSLDRFFAFTALVGMAGVQRLVHPFEHLVIEAELPEQRSEMLLQNLLAHILAATGCGFAPAFVRVSGAVVVDVFLLLD